MVTLVYSIVCLRGSYRVTFTFYKSFLFFFFVLLQRVFIVFRRDDLPAVGRVNHFDYRVVQFRVVPLTLVERLFRPGFEQNTVGHGYALLVQHVERQTVCLERGVWYFTSKVWQHVFTEQLTLLLRTKMYTRNIRS